MFVNTLASRNYPDSEKNAREFLEEIKESTLQAFENQEYQFEDLVDRVSVNRDTSRNPLFDTMLLLQNMEVQANVIPIKDIPQLKIRPYETPYRTSKFDLTLSCFEAEEKLGCSFEYCTKLFKKETLERFITYFKQILSAFLKDSNKKISQIEIITAEEKQQILYDFNNTMSQYPKDKTLHRLFEEQVERTPDNTALVGPKEEAGKLGSWEAKKKEDIFVTYKELNRRSNQLAYLLMKKGVKPDIIVGIMMERSLEMIIGILGILKAGGAYLPIDPDYPQERIDYMLKDSGTKILLSAGSHPDFSSSQLPSFSHLPIFSSSPLPSFPHLHLSPVPVTSLAYTIYTSGTSGKPKGVALEQKNLVNYVHWFSAAANITGKDKTLLTSSFAFDLGYTSLYTSLLNGGELHIVSREIYLLGERFLDLLRRHTVFVPFSRL
jgi:non-ribosomal peptide synthetase component F